jgi:hypothetical protein
MERDTRRFCFPFIRGALRSNAKRYPRKIGVCGFISLGIGSAEIVFEDYGIRWRTNKCN